jgi:Rieske Fe-S protein
VSSATDGLSRRRFLVVAGAAAAGACSSGAVPPASVGKVAVGNVSGVPVGTLQAVGGEAVCIGRDASGVYAMTLTCTHAGCDIGQNGTVSPQGLVCGCHGSEFDANGDVTHGPASQPLDHFAVDVDGQGNLTIDGTTVVSASQRLKV